MSVNVNLSQVSNIQINMLMSLEYIIERTPLNCLLYKWSNIDKQSAFIFDDFFFCQLLRCMYRIKICLYNIIEIVSSILLFTHGVIMDFLWQVYYEWATKWCCVFFVFSLQVVPRVQAPHDMMGRGNYISNIKYNIHIIHIYAYNYTPLFIQ